MWHSRWMFQYEDFRVFRFNLTTGSYSLWWKQHTQSTTHPVHNTPSPQHTQSTTWCLVGSLTLVTLYLHSSSHIASDSIRSPTSSAWRVSIILDRKDGCWKNMCMPLEHENPVLVVKRSGHRHLDCNPLDHYELKASNFNMQTLGKVCKRFRSSLLAVLE